MKRKLAKMFGVDLSVDGTGCKKWDKFFYRGIELGPFKDAKSLARQIFIAGQERRARDIGNLMRIDVNACTGHPYRHDYNA